MTGSDPTDQPLGDPSTAHPQRLGDLVRAARAWVRAHPFLVDSLLALLLWGVLVVLQGDARGMGSPWWPAFLTATFQTLPLAWRRARPVATFAVVSLACLASLPFTTEVRPADLGFLVALYAISASATSQPLRRTALGVGILASYVGAFNWSDNNPNDVAGAVFGGTFVALVTVVVWMWGNRAHERALLLAGLRAQNESLRRERDQRALLAAKDERTRIAREMHDVVAHSLAVIVVQADGAAYAARHGTAWDREQAVLALETIGTTAREAFGETRALVGVLREDGADPAAGPHAKGACAAYAPTASLADLPGLVERMRDAGHPVDLELPGLGELPRDVGLAAHRVVREALTNVLKHAGPQAHTTVSLRRTADQLLVTVEDDGFGAASPDDGAGHGLIGMCERVHAVGGKLTAGPRAGGGFRVHTALPVPVATTASTKEHG